MFRWRWSGGYGSGAIREVITDCKTGDPYLVRYTLFMSKWFRVCLHHILRSDADRDMHDHPRSFISIMLAGSYTEHSAKGVRTFRAGSVLWRPAPSPHLLELKQGTTAWTLVLFGRLVRQWGFLTPRGWVHWKKYLNAKGC